MLLPNAEQNGQDPGTAIICQPLPWQRCTPWCLPCVGFLALSPGTSVAITLRLPGKLTWVSQRDAPVLQAALEMTLAGGMVMADLG